MPEDRRQEELAAWARRVWPGEEPGELAMEPVAADGSLRLFLRLRAGLRSLVAMSNPDNPAENLSWEYLASHLGRLGLPVARVLAADQKAGRFLMEDLGSGSLMEAALELGDDQEALAALYRPVLAMLARLQARGGEGLDTSLCHDTPELTPEVLRAQEANYFLRELVLGAAAWPQEELPPGLEDELDAFCALAGQAGPRGLVHRDFQSRNIVYGRGRYGLVDFQGARLGPAQYDLASLLHDPYVQLPWGLRERLVDEYLELRAAEGAFDREAFRAGWAAVSASRLMQALGAFSFLTRKRNRPHFAASVAPALTSLGRVMADPGLAAYSALGRVITGAPGRLGPESFAFSGKMQ
ncbi:MAG: phosphotransferase [Desulfarculaceae bacterium]|nr:phosphotransferase [Desulfarculaceae bacterium]MCF8070977.1 phosphotransferase [Desulfarculaceae bacterium]MCF8100565.1 phosphotransferase [Desulfarculaceae bacterium]MCF8116591.1 phosphotransferase [Desulfarculaceae bacterium]